MITITNTLSGKKEVFKPRNDKVVKLYVCGITPYDYAHIGHGRVYVTFDVFYRLLKFLGYTVTYCRNYTDIDDKLLNKALKEFGDEHRYQEVATRYINAYAQDMQRLRCLTPSFEPRVTECIPQIIDFIKGLIDAGKAYVVGGDVYYSIATFPSYGELSKQKLDELRVGARVEASEQKRDPLDFALWKSEAEGLFWKSPWGWGRPGWHIECSAMASAYLDKHIDIHAGGMDLIFPHHENEVAQSEGLYGHPFAQYWMHNAFVRINKEKMSKSLGNFFTLRQVFENFDPMVVRYYYLTHHYRSPLDFSFDDLQAVQKSYQKVCKALESISPEQSWDKIRESKLVQAMVALLADDLNTPGMFGIVFEHLKELQENRQAAAVKAFLQEILGLSLVPLLEKEVEVTPEMQRLLQEREEARAAKDWKKADELRDQLIMLGYAVKDKRV